MKVTTEEGQGYNNGNIGVDIRLEKTFKKRSDALDWIEFIEKLKLEEK